MISATTAALTTAGQSLRTLIDAATPSQITPSFNSRVFEIQIQWVSGDFHLVFKAGTVNLATDSGFQFSTNDRLLTMRSPSANQLSLADVFLAGATGAGEVARISATTM